MEEKCTANSQQAKLSVQIFSTTEITRYTSQTAHVHKQDSYLIATYSYQT
jgi:hypothetical protein